MRCVVVLALLAGCGRIGFDATARGDDGGPGDDAPLPVGRWKRVSVSHLSGCGITVSTELWCWGQGFSGQLGIGDTPSFAPPTRVGTTSDWADVAVDGEHACAVRTDGSLWCWGDNSVGELGAGVLGQYYDTPQQVSPGTKWKTIAAGDEHTCAIRDDDTMWCWGGGSVGQLGISSVTDEQRPVMTVPGGVGHTAVEIGLGYETTCAINDQRTMWCWGANAEGQIGDGTLMRSTVPILIEPGRTWLGVTVGQEHTCALDSTGAAWCWGRNYEGQLGDGTVIRKRVPTRVVQVPAFVQIAAGDLHTCGIAADGEVWCWGDATRGQLSGVEMVDSRVPQRLTAPHATSVNAGGQTTCLVDEAAHLFCIGANGSGQSGVAAGEVHGVERADARTDWSAIYAQGTHACGRLTNGLTQCWGRGTAGQVGDGANLDRQGPAGVGALVFDHIEIGDITSVGFVGGIAYGWGYDHLTDTFLTTPTLRGSSAAAALGGTHSCTVDVGGQLECFGDNSRGQIGDGTTTDAPAGYTLGGTWRLVAAWYEVTCATDLTNKASCWGDGSKTGTGTVANVTAPQGVGGLPSPVTRIELGPTGGCALVGAGQLFCWGQNRYGEVGDGGLTQRLSAVRVGTRADWRVVDLGDLHACAIPADGTLWCWGHDDQGQLGQSSLTDKRTPAQVGTATDWADVACGDHFTCAVKTDGTRWCFGVNGAGELGNDRAWLTALTVVP